ncbi:MAG: hypothetical protein HFF37_04125 [Coprobacillus sp.]|uniref:hypothetical protein n=1 Tax=Romboutsia ilealis TaxID=1115758 RepID=UPI00216C4FA1|nr:hypothetical protein [Romboutsia ilealis]MCI9049563.1 hypothetical protein [Coprobacillus sp.]
MAYSKDKVRITIPIPKDVDERLENLASKLATSKSKMCAQLIVEGIDNYEMAWKMMNNPDTREQFLKFMQQNDEK